jgi:hypothetical protein
VLRALISAIHPFILQRENVNNRTVIIKVKITLAP